MKWINSPAYKDFSPNIRHRARSLNFPQGRIKSTRTTNQLSYLNVRKTTSTNYRIRIKAQNITHLIIYNGIWFKIRAEFARVLKSTIGSSLT
jgi:hypothetical protein